jgi:hypothetical protein
LFEIDGILGSGCPSDLRTSIVMEGNGDRGVPTWSSRWSLPRLSDVGTRMLEDQLEHPNVGDRETMLP